MAVSGLPADGDEVVRRLGDAGHTATCFLGNMGDDQFCQDLVRGTYDTYGRVDFLINNAFSFLAKRIDATRDDFNYSFSTGPIAFARMIQLVVGPMSKDGGAIVNNASVSAHIAQSTAGPTACPRALSSNSRAAPVPT